jgi:hypothetical protein
MVSEWGRANGGSMWRESRKTGSKRPEQLGVVAVVGALIVKGAVF